MKQRSLPDINADLAELLRQKLGIRRGVTLEAKLNKGGRLLPRAVRREARYLASAETRFAHPRLRRQIDPVRVMKAERVIRRHLQGVDPGLRQRRLWGGIAAGLAFNFLLIAGVVIAWMWNTGRL